MKCIVDIVSVENNLLVVVGLCLPKYLLVRFSYRQVISFQKYVHVIYHFKVKMFSENLSFDTRIFI